MPAATAATVSELVLVASTHCRTGRGGQLREDLVLDVELFDDRLDNHVGLLQAAVIGGRAEVVECLRPFERRDAAALDVGGDQLADVLHSAGDDTRH